MIKLSITILIALAASSVSAPQFAHADGAPPTLPTAPSAPVPPPDKLALSTLFADNMVLQETTDAPVWGVDKPGSKVVVTLGKTKATATADKDGNWRVDLRKLVAPGPYVLTVADKTDTDTFNNVAVGEVWIASGQSNMELQVTQTLNAAQEIAGATDAGIRLFHEDHDIAFAPRTSPLGTWQVCSPQSVPDFSAAGYYFARQLRKDLGVPVGIIQATWGGIAAEAFTPLDALSKDPLLTPQIDAYNKQFGTHTDDYRAAELDYDAKHADWLKTNSMVDPGNTGFAQGWAKPDADTSSWQSVPAMTNRGNIAGSWSKWGPQMNVNGAVWLRKDVNIPAAWAGKDLMLHAGQIRDYDTTYFNGVQVGAIGPGLPLWWDIQRRYVVPGNLVKAGRNVIAIRIFNQAGDGGMYSSIEALQIAPNYPPDYRGPKDAPVPLDGPWLYKTEVTRDAAGIPREPQMSRTTPAPWMPAGLWNGMIAPLVPYGMRGVIWYQGESNADRAEQYKDLFPTMIRAWRSNWGEGNFPFVFAQIATWGDPVKTDPRVPALRDAQMSALSEPDTAMVVTLDTSSGANIHPVNKQATGRRFALAAMALAYGGKDEYEGPICTGTKVEGAQMRLSFSHATGGLTTLAGEPLTGFEITADGTTWFPATATIDGSDVLLSSASVTAPTAARYAWSSNWPQSPPPPNLANKAGLPAGTFYAAPGK